MIMAKNEVYKSNLAIIRTRFPHKNPCNTFVLLRRFNVLFIILYFLMFFATNVHHFERPMVIYAQKTIKLTYHLELVFCRGKSLRWWWLCCTMAPYPLDLSWQCCCIWLFHSTPRSLHREIGWCVYWRAFVHPDLWLRPSMPVHQLAQHRQWWTRCETESFVCMSLWFLFLILRQNCICSFFFSFLFCWDL